MRETRLRLRICGLSGKSHQIPLAAPLHAMVFMITRRNPVVLAHDDRDWRGPFLYLVVHGGAPNPLITVAKAVAS